MTGSKRLSRALVTTLLVVIANVASVVSPASAAPAVTLSRGGGPPGTPFTVSGSGFAANEGIDVELDGFRIGHSATDEDGSFSGVPARAPYTASPGRHKIVVFGRRSGLARAANFTVQTNWSQGGYSSRNRRMNPHENQISVGNASQLDVDWRSPSAGTKQPGDAATYAGYLYVAKGNHLAAYQGCNYGSGVTCAPKWTATLANSNSTGVAVANGRVFVAAETIFYAFPLKCTSPCSPVATGTLPSGTFRNGHYFSPTVARGTIYFGADDGVYGYDTRCTTPCEPSKKFVTNGPTAKPAVAHDTLYALSTDAAGNSTLSFFETSCTSPCSPFTAYATGVPGSAIASPLLARGTAVFADGGRVWGFPAECRVCSPRWTAMSSNGSSATASPVAAGAFVYIAHGGVIDSFRLRCLGSCTSVNPATLGGQIWGMSASPGILWVNSNQGTEARNLSCISCEALWSHTSFDVTGSPVISDAVVYASHINRTFAFHRDTGDA